MDNCDHKTSELLVKTDRFEVHRCTWGCDELFANEFDPDLPLPIVKETHPARYHGENSVLWHPRGQSARQYTIGYGVK